MTCRGLGWGRFQSFRQREPVRALGRIHERLWGVRTESAFPKALCGNVRTPLRRSRAFYSGAHERWRGSGRGGCSPVPSTTPRRCMERGGFAFHGRGAEPRSDRLSLTRSMHHVHDRRERMTTQQEQVVHTPGPWAVARSEHVWFINQGLGGRAVAECGNEADACLIATAPALLAAADALLNDEPWAYPNNAKWAALREAVAAARGAQQ